MDDLDLPQDLVAPEATTSSDAALLSKERVALEEALSHVDLSGDMEDETLTSAFILTFEKLEETEKKTVNRLLDEQSAEFAQRAEELKDVDSSLQRAKARLGEAAKFVDLENFSQKDAALAREQKALDQQCEGIDQAVGVLEGLAEIHACLQVSGGQNQSQGHKHLYECCQAVGRALALLVAISAPDQHQEPAIIRHVRHDLSERRQALTNGLLALVGKFFIGTQGDDVSREQRRLTIQPMVSDGDLGNLTISEFWACARVLDVMDEVIRACASHVLSRFVFPLLSSAAASSSGSVSVPQHPDKSVTFWSYVHSGSRGSSESPMAREDERCNTNADNNSNAAAGLPSILDVFPVLKSLFSFIQGAFGSESGEAFRLFGRVVWPPVTRCLLKSFRVEWKDARRIADFESEMVELDIAHGKTLRQAAWKKSDARFQVFEKETLVRARELLSCKVPDSERFTDDVGGDVSPAESIGKNLGHVRGMFADLMRMPTCTVSRQSRQFVDLLKEILNTANDEWHAGRKNEAFRLVDFLKSLLVLFTLMRPHAQMARLKNDAKVCSLFFNDCMYVSHKLLCLPHQYEPILPPELLSKLLTCMNFVTDIRYLAEFHFLEGVQHQNDRMDSVLEQTNGFVNCASARNNNFVLSAVGSVLGSVQEVSAGWSQLLPLNVFHRAIGRVLDHLAKRLIDQIFALSPNTCNSQDMPQLKGFLDTIVDTINVLVLSREEDAEMPETQNAASLLSEVAPDVQIIYNCHLPMLFLFKFSALRESGNCDFTVYNTNHDAYLNIEQ